MPHWDQPEPCKVFVKTVHEWFKFACLCWMSMRTWVSNFVFVEPMHHFCRTGVIFYWKADYLDD